MDATKAAWRCDAAEIRSLGCDEAGLNVLCCPNLKLGFRSLDSVDMDDTKAAWRFVAAEIQSLESEALIYLDMTYVGQNSILAFNP